MTAHVTFSGGGLILPADTAYDRQLLREHVLDRAQREDRVRISLAGEAWVVERLSGDHRPSCEGCKRLLTAAALRKADSDASFCLACALP
ncbi:MAG: hypothetical protein ABSA52_16900 [Candidatus Binatia bacterium]|jgi:hypothetical protein